MKINSIEALETSHKGGNIRDVSAESTFNSTSLELQGNTCL